MESQKPTRNMRILVIDDNIDAADMMAEMLEHLGFSAIAVHDGRGGLDRAQTEPPNVVFLDLGMPEMDGFQVAQALRRLPNAEQIRIVALTAWNDAATTERLEQSCFDDHITKPATIDQLLKTISQCPDHDLH